MFTKVIDIVLGRNIEVEFPEEGNSAIALIWITWFSIMLYLVLSVI